ncbi:hypothetical protein DSO57_1010556 [Entomophthora muscae]|uniref:Uncharacterized protein n=1 Tax=Entomophthora muscae TaxID=34485 RepID=A0ACC2SVP6_9FUNG|nr:hypothetical protein DSO57_1010556 [Entomophthora muscae]
MSSDYDFFASSPLTSIPSSPPALLSRPRPTVGLSFASSEEPVDFHWTSDASSSFEEPSVARLDLPTQRHAISHPEKVEIINQPQIEVPAKTSRHASVRLQTNTSCATASPASSTPPPAKFNFDPRIYNQKYLLQKYPNTFFLRKIVDILNIPIEDLVLALESTVCAEGKPLLIRNFHKLPQFDRNLFSLEWLKANKEEVEVAVRNLEKSEDVPMPFSEFLDRNQGKSHKDIKYYGKDIECPPEWHEHAKELLPSYLGANDLNCKLLIMTIIYF